MRFVALIVLAALASPAAAFEIGAMSDTERAAFRSEVREYLLENPEVLMEALTELQNREAISAAEAEVAMISQNAEAIFADSHSWVGGNPDGDVTLVEFMDYRCGYCRKAFEEIEALVATDGNIRLVIKELPILGEQSDLSSRYAIATKILLGDAAYEQMHRALMTLRGDATPAALQKVATGLGFDAGAIAAKLNAPEVDAVIDLNASLAQTLQIQGTPSFVLPTGLLRGYLPLSDMMAEVAAARAE